MTKLFSIIAVAIIAASVVSCGPSAEEKAKMEELAKLKADSAEAAIKASIEEVFNEATDTTAAPTVVESTTITTETHTGH